jgi:hypothetical protein|nr:MAG TPA: hypothetical protein [Caudoviricetes sp.]
MKVELQCGDSITIPDGCKAVVKDGSVTFVKEEEDKEFKDGDILIDDRKLSEFPCKIIMIYKGAKSEDGCYECYIFRNLMGSLVINKGCCGSEFVRIRHATEEEKAELFDKMKEQGFKWNAEEKKVEKIKWRAEEGDGYFYVDNQGRKIAKNEECKFVDEDRFAFGNYFRTINQAEEAVRRMKEVLIQYHEEIGE